MSHASSVLAGLPAGPAEDSSTGATAVAGSGTLAGGRRRAAPGYVLDSVGSAAESGRAAGTPTPVEALPWSGARGDGGWAIAPFFPARH